MTQPIQLHELGSPPTRSRHRGLALPLEIG